MFFRAPHARTHTTPTQRSDRVFEAKVSYLEIYNEGGYDLLDPNHEITKMEDLPRVELMDTGGGDVVLRNLSQNAVASDEDALNALFIGDTNRMIAETPMNQASTRSHCVFTIHVTSRVHGAAVMRRSKLHLVVSITLRWMCGGAVVGCVCALLTSWLPTTF